MIYTLAGALPMGSALILLPFYVSYLSASDFGALSIYLGFSYFVQILTTYSFDTSVYIHFHEFKDDQAKLSSFVSSSFILMLLIGLCVGILFSITGDILFRSIFPESRISFQPYGFMAALAGMFQGLFKVYGSLLQSRGKPMMFLWSNLSFFIVIAGATVLGLTTYPGSLVGPVGGRLLAAFICGVGALLLTFREFGLHFNYGLLRATFSFNFYTFLYQLLQWVINYFDRIFMAFFLTLTQVGVYDFALKCLLIIEFVLNGLHNSFYPKVVSTVIAQDKKGSSHELNRYYHAFIGLVLLLICLCILFFPPAIEIFVDKPGYSESAKYIPYISLIYIFRAIRLFYATPYGILKYTKPLSWIYLMVSTAKILLMWIGLARFGIFAVIGASIISAWLEIWLLKRGLENRFEFRYNALKILGAPAVMFLIIVCLEPLFGSEAPLLTHMFYMVACLGLLGWIYRNEIRLISPFNILR